MPSTSHSATCPPPSVPSSTAISAAARHCQKVLDEYSDIGRIIKNLPPHVEPPADLEDRTVAAMVAALAEQRATTDRRPDAEDRAVTRVYPSPERQHLPEPETRVQPSPQFQPPAEDEARAPAIARRPAGTGRAAGPADGHPPAGVAALPRPPRRCRCRGRCDHRRRHRRPAQPWRRRPRPKSQS